MGASPVPAAIIPILLTMLALYWSFGKGPVGRAKGLWVGRCHPVAGQRGYSLSSVVRSLPFTWTFSPNLSPCTYRETLPSGYLQAEPPRRTARHHMVTIHGPQ